MPCPYFEPLRVAAEPKFRNARLPLIDEYDGLCRAREEPADAPRELRFSCCNHGYSRGLCERFPAGEGRSAVRFHVMRATDAGLEVVCVEETDHVPVRWYTIEYFSNGEGVNPEIEDTCMRAQVSAFCRSYLARFPT